MLVGLEDERVRLDALLDVYQGQTLTAIVNCAASIAFYTYYDFVRASPLLVGTLLVWSALGVYHLSVQVQIKRCQAAAQESDSNCTGGLLNAQRTRSLILRTCYLALMQASCLCIIALASLKYESIGLNSPVVVGVLIYYFGAELKAIRIPFDCMVYNGLLLLPIAFVLTSRGDIGNAIIGIFFLMLMVTMWTFGAVVRKGITTQILQRFELESLNATLEVERQRADAANEAKSHFFTAASHDARQPLQAIALLSESLMRSPTLTAPDRRLAERITANLHSIRNLFNRVLDVSRIESGAITVTRQPLKLQKLFDQLDAQFGEQAANKGLWLRFVPTNAVLLHDTHLLERMLGNLIDNALKCTDRGGVWVAYRMERSRIEVRDSGKGLSAAEQKRVFEEFYQVSNAARSREAGAGLGLGLSIVERLGSLTDTPIGLRSAPGKGSTFWLTVVTSKTCAEWGANATQLHQRPDISLESGTWENPSLALPLKGRHLLLVDDDAELLTLLEVGLQALGAQVHCCANAPAVQQWLASQSTAGPVCDLIVTDFRLGEGGSGLDVICWTRRRLGRAVPTIVITGDTAMGGFAVLGQLPQVSLLHKPVSMEDLTAECVRSLVLGAAN